MKGEPLILKQIKDEYDLDPEFFSRMIDLYWDMRREGIDPKVIAEKISTRIYVHRQDKMYKDDYPIIKYDPNIYEFL